MFARRGKKGKKSNMEGFRVDLLWKMQMYENADLIVTCPFWEESMGFPMRFAYTEMTWEQDMHTVSWGRPNNGWVKLEIWSLLEPCSVTYSVSPSSRLPGQWLAAMCGYWGYEIWLAGIGMCCKYKIHTKFWRLGIRKGLTILEWELKRRLRGQKEDLDLVPSSHMAAHNCL